MAHTGKRFPLPTKLALAIVVIVAIAGFLYYNPGIVSKVPIGSFGNVGGLTDIFGTANGERLNFTMTSSESFLSGDINLQGASVVVRGMQSVGTSVGDSVFDNSGKDSELQFEGFNGKMNIVGGKLSIDGTATSASADGTKIKPKSNSFAVSAQLTPVSYSISPVSIDRISLDKVYGSIERLGDESSTTQLSNSTVEISSFSGSMSFDGKNHIITGSATEVKGKSFTLKG